GSASAFFLKALPQSRVMVRFGHAPLARMKGRLSAHGRRDGQIAHADIHAHNALVRGGLWLGGFDGEGEQQVKLFLSLIIPQFGCSNLGPLLESRDMLRVSTVGNNDTPYQIFTSLSRR